MHVTQIKRLTDTEFQNTVTTSLFAELVKRKFHIRADTQQDLENLLNSLDEELESTWFFQRETGYESLTGVIYLSTDVDAKVMRDI